MNKININFTPKQAKAYKKLIDDHTSQILYGGSAGGGKSFLGVMWLIINSLKYDNTRWVMGRSVLKQLKRTTLATFFEITKKYKLQDQYKYNAVDNIIKFNNGSEIMLLDLAYYPSDPNFDGLGSLEITGAFIDEANQVTLKAKNILNSRIRYKLDEYNLYPKLLMTCNPAKNWVYNDFYKPHRDNKLEDYKCFIKATLDDNKFISKHYKQQLLKLDKISRDRLLHGKWEYNDDNSLIDYDHIINMFDEYNINLDKIDPNNIIISCDVARKGNDKAVIMVWDEYNIIQIKTFDKSTIKELVNQINKLKEKYKVKSNKKIVIDGDGVGGGVVDYLNNSIDFINNSKPFNKENYQNLKTQCYSKLAELINLNKIGIINLFDESIREEIIENLEYVKRKDIDKDQKYKIISKEEIKAQTGKSPDFSDCMMMRMYFEYKNSRLAFKIS